MATRGRPRKQAPDVAPMDALDVYNTFRGKGVSVSQSASASMYAVVAQVVGWDNLGLTPEHVQVIRGLYIKCGINPDRIEGVNLSDKRRAELTAGVQLAGLAEKEISTPSELGSSQLRRRDAEQPTK